jgi:uncharacterized protein YegP (UPF0339 family)
MGKFVIKTDKRGEYRFNLLAENGQVILSSEGYTTKSACENGIESVMKNAPEMGRFEKNSSANGKHYFNLKASNGQIIGTSQMYEAVQSRDNGISSVATNGPIAKVVDESA